MKTVILNDLEWMTENLSGYGGTEVGGNTYYTWNEAKKAVEEIGDGWRLPTKEEIDALCSIYSVWDKEQKGRWFGDNKELFFPASGYREKLVYDFGFSGHYWSSYSSKYIDGVYLYIERSGVGSYYNGWSFSYSVRLVRDSFRKRSKKLREDIIKGIIEKILEKNTHKIDFSMILTCANKEVKTSALKVSYDKSLFIEYVDALSRYDREINSNDIYDISVDDLIKIYNRLCR